MSEVGSPPESQQQEVPSADTTTSSSLSTSFFDHGVEERLTDWVEPASPLIALVDCGDFHSDVISQPSINTSLAPLRFLSFPDPETVAFPRKKMSSHRFSSYENYTPDGILPNSWIQKHRNQVPSVVVTFAAWDDSKSFEWQAENLIRMVLKISDANQPREMGRLIVILRTGMCTDELEKKYIHMARACNLDSKSVFIFNTLEPSSYMGRLEETIRGLSKEYYLSSAKRVKKLKEKVNRHAQAKLLTRHHFKIAYFYEAHGDFQLSLKYYKSSYDFLKQFYFQNLDPMTFIEIKMVAYVLNFKIMQLYFAIGQHDEALTQFNSHISTFLEANKIPELKMHHYGWLSKQYRVLGEMYESARVRQSRSQNPGFFFEGAGKYFKKRKQEAVKAIAQYLNVDPITGTPTDARDILEPAFLGQIVLDDARLDPNAYLSVCVQSLLSNERSLSHADTVIELLTKAYEHFKQQKSNRMILHIASLMAEEYYEQEKYSMAKKFYDRIAKTYRKEKWTSILSEIVGRSFECARHLKMYRDVLVYSIELMSPLITTSLKEKEALQRGVLKLITGWHIESPPPTQTATQPGGLMPGMFGAFDCRAEDGLLSVSAHLSSPSAPVNGVVYANEMIPLSLYITSKFPSSAYFQYFVVTFSQCELTVLLHAKDTPVPKGCTSTVIVAVDTSFEGGASREYNVEIPASAVSEQCTSMELEPMSLYAYFTYPEQHRIDNPPVAVKEGCTYLPALELRCPIWKPGMDKFRQYEAESPALSAVNLLDDVKIGEGEEKEKEEKEEEKNHGRGASIDSRRLPLVSIQPVKPKAVLSVSSLSPAVVNEYFSVVLSIDAKEDEVHNGSVVCSHSPDPPIPPEHITKEIMESVSIYTRTGDGTYVLLRDAISLSPSSLSPGQTTTVEVFVNAVKPCRKLISFNFSYETASGEKAILSLSESLHVVRAFTPTFRTFSPWTPVMMNSINGTQRVDPTTDERRKTLILGSQFVMPVDLTNSSQHSIALHSAAFVVNSAAFSPVGHSVGGNVIKQRIGGDGSPVVLKPNERHSLLFTLIPTKKGSFKAGHLRIQWSHASAVDTARSTAIKDGEEEEKKKVEKERESGDTVTLSKPRDHVVFDIVSPNYHIGDCPFTVEVEQPSSCEISRTFLLEIRITNNTTKFQDIQLVVPAPPNLRGGSSRATSPHYGRLVFHGPSQDTFRVLPGLTKSIKYRMAPLQCGDIPLPHIYLTSLSLNAVILEPQDLGSIFVYPRVGSIEQRRNSVMNLTSIADAE